MVFKKFWNLLRIFLVYFSNKKYQQQYKVTYVHAQVRYYDDYA